MKIIGCILYIAGTVYYILYIYINYINLCKTIQGYNTIADKVIINNKNNNVTSNY